MSKDPLPKNSPRSFWHQSNHEYLGGNLGAHINIKGEEFLAYEHTLTYN